MVPVPSGHAGFGGLYQGTPTTWHRVADLQVPGLGKVAQSSLGCNFISGIECVSSLLIVLKLQKALPGDKEGANNSRVSWEPCSHTYLHSPDTRLLT